jgi:hypothetical protein
MDPNFAILVVISTPGAFIIICSVIRIPPLIALKRAANQLAVRFAGSSAGFRGLHRGGGRSARFPAGGLCGPKVQSLVARRGCGEETGKPELPVRVFDHGHAFIEVSAGILIQISTDIDVALVAGLGVLIVVGYVHHLAARTRAAHGGTPLRKVG